jgi:hypothetical protein
MIIIALGEAIIQMGAGAMDVHQPGVVASLVLGVLISATLWWSYFGLTAGAEKRLRQASGIERALLARDAYSYLHLLLVAGIVVFCRGRPRGDRPFWGSAGTFAPTCRDGWCRTVLPRGCRLPVARSPPAHRRSAGHRYCGPAYAAACYPHSGSHDTADSHSDRGPAAGMGAVATTPGWTRHCRKRPIDIKSVVSQPVWLTVSPNWSFGRVPSPRLQGATVAGASLLD